MKDSRFKGSANQKKKTITVCPPFLEMTKWDDYPLENVNIPETGTIFLSIGRIAAHKKVQDVIELFEMYSRLDPESSLIIVGTLPSDGYGNYLKCLLCEKYSVLRERIHFLDNISQGQLKTVFKNCSALITMSEHEGYGIPVVEAMYFGKPVFAYAHPALRETLGTAGRLFYEKNFPALASQIYGCLHDENQLDEILKAQAHRIREICLESDGGILWGAIEEVLFGL